MKERARQEARRRLEAKLLPFGAAGGGLRQAKGWARATRRALRVPAAEVATRLGTTRRAVYRLEEAEAAGRLELGRLRLLAAALDCELVYALRPAKGTLEGLAAEAERLREEAQERRWMRRKRQAGAMLSGAATMRREARLALRRLGIRV